MHLVVHCSWFQDIGRHCIGVRVQSMVSSPPPPLQLAGVLDDLYFGFDIDKDFNLKVVIL